MFLVPQRGLQELARHSTIPGLLQAPWPVIMRAIEINSRIKSFCHVFRRNNSWDDITSQPIPLTSPNNAGVHDTIDNRTISGICDDQLGDS